LNRKVFYVYGGCSAFLESPADLTLIDKPINRVDTWDDDLVCDLLWSDPSCDAEYILESDRGCGHLFGEEALCEFLDRFGCTTMIHAHECVHERGIRPFGKDKCFTIFSSADSGQRMNPAFAALVSDTVERIEVFEPIRAEEQPMRRVLLRAWLLLRTLPAHSVVPA
jgi:hypothetical protein